MKNRTKKRRHVLIDVEPREKLTVYDIHSRFAVELNVIEKGIGRLAIDFNIPGSMRVAKGSLS